MTTNDHSSTLKFCTQCFHACEVTTKKSSSKFFTVMAILVGVITFIFIITSAALQGIFFMLFSAGSLTCYYYLMRQIKEQKNREANTCPRCLNDTLLPMDHAVAKKIIKDNQLNIQEILYRNPIIEEQKARYPWQTS